MAGSMRLVRGRNTWELRAFAGRDEYGKVRHRYATFTGSRNQAEKALARLVTETERQKELAGAQAPVTTIGPETTINKALEAWRANGWEDLSPTTTRRYQGMWTGYVRDGIGRRPIRELTPYDFERFFRALKGKGLSEATVRQVRAMLHRACRLARRWSGGTLNNPVTDTELPTWRLEESPGPVRAPAAQEVLDVVRSAAEADVRLGALILTVAATGVRRGEACALRWSDLDFDAGTLLVDEAIVSARGGAVVQGPKTRASVRRVVVDPDTMNKLTGLRSEQERLARSCGLELGPDAFVFSYEPGGESPPHPDSISHAFGRARDAAAVAADVHLHSLRHFHATQIDVVVSEAQKQARLGWSTVQMARHYTDAVPEEDRRAAEHIGRVLHPQRSGRSGARPRSGTGARSGTNSVPTGSSSVGAGRPTNKRSTAKRGMR